MVKKIFEKLSMSSGYIKKTGLALALCLLILAQALPSRAFEAHIITVKAYIANDTPSATPPGGQFCDSGGDVLVTLSVNLPLAEIWYTTDGTEPECFGTMACNTWIRLRCRWV